VVEFFDRFPVFYSSSDVGAYPNRLNNRHRAIIGPIRHELTGADVLDIGSHDGRWGFAALEAGACHVTGIEPRSVHIHSAADVFAGLNVNPNRFEFHKSAVMDWLGEGLEFDFVFCLGVLYHTDQGIELLRRCCKWAKHGVVIDSRVIRAPRPVMRYELERSGDPGNGYGPGPEVMVGIPSIPLIDLTLRQCGFQIAQFHEWHADDLVDPGNWEDLDDYKNGTRISLVARPIAP
jgi:hypothetical protein